MNMQGLFASCQGLIPEEKSPATRVKNQISTWIFHKLALSSFEQVPQAMVFDPYKKEIFICLEGNFDKIWKVSLVNQSIGTWRGFTSFRRQPIPAEGMSGADLAQW
jgi:hypothetical protein